MNETASKEIGKRIRERREQMGMTQAELGARIGKSGSSVRVYEHGNSQIWRHQDLLAAIAAALSLKLEDLTAGASDAPTPKRSLRPLRGTPEGRIKVLGAAAAGNDPAGLPDDDLMNVPIEMADPDYSGLFVEGDSMMPFLHPADIAIFRDHPSERVGLIFAVRRPDNGICVKRLIFDGGWKLESLNPSYEPVPLMPGDQLLGFLVGLVRTEGSKRTIVHDPAGLRGDGWQWGV